MTGPVTTEALVEKLARDLAREGGWNDPDAPWTENQVIIARGGAGEPVWRDFVDDARSLLGRETFTTLLAALQQVTAERDEAQEKICSACLDALVAQDQAAENDGRARTAEASLATATSELARLRAEGEAKDRALKAKAEEQVAYWRKRQEAEKSPEDGISEDGETYTPIGDVAAWQGGYCNGRMSEADWWLKTLQHWPNEAARAATAREGA